LFKRRTAALFRVARVCQRQLGIFVYSVTVTLLLSFIELYCILITHVTINAHNSDKSKV